MSESSNESNERGLISDEELPEDLQADETDSLADEGLDTPDDPLPEG